MNKTDLQVIFMIFIQLCITCVYLAPFIFMAYIGFNQLFYHYISKILNTTSETSDIDYEIFNILDSGIYG